jgi:hypothetical protein
MRNLKINKLAGTDGIRPELLKYRGIKLLNKMYELVRQIWEAEGIPAWLQTPTVLWIGGGIISPSCSTCMGLRM